MVIFKNQTFIILNNLLFLLYYNSSIKSSKYKTRFISLTTTTICFYFLSIIQSLYFLILK